MDPISVEFISEGAKVRGRFFAAVETDEPTTLLFIPGWSDPAGDPYDDLSLSALLAEKRINVCTFNPRGLHPSGGIHTHAGTLQDIGAALQWLRQAEVQKQFKVDTARLALGGYSYGGGMAMAYAAQDPSVHRVISIAGNDHGEFAREIQRHTPKIESILRWLSSTYGPEGPARGDFEANIKDLIEHQDIYGLRENAANLADRSILMVSGWEDTGPTIDEYQLPLYRALKDAGAANVTFIVYHTDHNFSNVRQRLASDIADWLLRGLNA